MFAFIRWNFVEVRGQANTGEEGRSKASLSRISASSLKTKLTEQWGGAHSYVYVSIPVSPTEGGVVRAVQAQDFASHYSSHGVTQKINSDPAGLQAESFSETWMFSFDFRCEGDT